MGFLKRLFGPKKNEQQQMQEQMNTLYRECINVLEVEMFRRLSQIAETRFPGRDAGAMAAQIKIHCTGDSQNERSSANSTEKDRALAKQFAAEIMALDVDGLYGVRIDQFVDIVQGLPDDLTSIKRLALCFDQYAAILISSLATDVSNPLTPAVDRDYLREKAIPLLTNAEEHNPNNAVLQTTIAQTYYTLNELDRGLAAAEKATKLDENNAEAWRLVGNAYMMKGDDAHARRCFIRALDLEPNLDGARQALALLS